ncbi:nucleoside hydrolase [Undibacterium sp. SXout7W]|uniref:nucleoside hydrolase n=1 Tax=Undibacterium sp. SXout7W TaxID=3413049 RepID=UPI003BF2DAE0
MSNATFNATDIVIDCDPGIDDALALLLAAASSHLNMLAVTTVTGNRPVALTAYNARNILDLAHKQNVPVYAGAERSIFDAGSRCNLVHGEDGLGGLDIPSTGKISAGHAVYHLIRLLSEHQSNSITLIAIGPLTNLALAELLSPGILLRARKILIMGGALRCAGNITPAAEFNFYADPIAAQIVMQSGAQIVLFPLDVTSSAVMSSDWIRSFDHMDSACGKAVTHMLDAYSKLDPLLHDACPVAYCLDESLFSGEYCRVEIDCSSEVSAGHCKATFFDSSTDSISTNVHAMIYVNNAALLPLIHKHICNLP